MSARSEVRILAAIAVLLSLPSAAVAQSDLARSIAAGAKRGAARFETIYRETGISGVSEAVEACYRSPRSRQGIGALAECAGLDIMGANVDGQAVASLGVPGYGFFSGPALEKRVAAGMKAAGLSKVERREFDRAIMAYLNGSAETSTASATPSAAAEVMSLRSLDGLPFDHNGSEMIVDAAKGVIVYAKPKASIVGTVEPGTVLFRGEPWSLDPRSSPIRGKAYVFRKGCAPAPYEVRGTYRGEGFVLTGIAPVRAKESCAVTGASTSSGNARLAFESTYMDE
ncbi:hypothetical protein [Aureimonas sp. AU40]|uniref:hypothetical protein n=1 Tax=Aureimonas sp. AU40 TaxID=1637747 RepID=UPI00078160D4|nr:hypothetical protein [Aureimonas sp. AU40]